MAKYKYNKHRERKLSASVTLTPNQSGAYSISYISSGGKWSSDSIVTLPAKNSIDLDAFISGHLVVNQAGFNQLLNEEA